MRESPYIKSIGWQAPAIAGITLVMAVTGPFGTYEHMSLGIRLVYFGILGILNWLQVVFLIAWFGEVEPIDRWPIMARIGLVGILAAVPGSVEVILVLSLLGHDVPWIALMTIYPENVLLTIAISIGFGLFIEQRLHAIADAERARVADLPSSLPAAGSQPDFFRRIPPALGRDLLALQMEDHYLRIHTAVGSDLILLRLRDAMAELGPAHGRQVHRSWWVAQGALTSAERDNGKNVLVLRNGLRVPVSKTFRNRLKEAGWLAS